MKNIDKIINENIKNFLKHNILQEYSEKEWDDAWNEYYSMDGNYPEDESAFDEIIATPKRDMGKLNSTFGNLYANDPIYNGDVDPLIKKVTSNTLRGFMSKN